MALHFSVDEILNIFAFSAHVLSAMQVRVGDQLQHF